MVVPTVRRVDVLRFRARRHGLDREPGSARAWGDVALLDYGVQDTGNDGAGWALALRGAPDPGPDDGALAWTLRGAPHAYRRADLAAVAVATAPLSEADAAKRVFDAAKPLRVAGIAVLDALAEVAGHLRDIVTAPTPKGEASARLAERVGEPYLRWCRPCQATHVHEQPFRLSALQAGLELEPGTSPPVLRRVPGLEPPGYRRLAGEAEPRLDVVRNHLRFFGPVRVRDVASFLDAPQKDVRAAWPADAVEVEVADEHAGGRSERRSLLAEDLDALLAAGPGEPVAAVRLLGPYDPYLQLRDRDLLVADEARRKDLWRVLGRPGAAVEDGEVVATWRPRTKGRALEVHVEPWAPLDAGRRALVEEQAEALAARRGVALAAVVVG